MEDLMEDLESSEMSSSAKALQFAVRSGSPVLVRILLWISSSVNARDDGKRTALHWACETLADRSSVMDVLLRAGAEVDARDCWGRTPLHEACRSTNQHAVVQLLNHGADSSLVDNDGRTPLHVVAGLEESTDTLSIANALLANTKSGCPEEKKSSEDGGVVNAQDYNGNTALHLASKRNNKNLVWLLSRTGATVGVKNATGITVLHLASQNNAKEVVSLLLCLGAKVEDRDHGGRTALHWAADASAKDIVVILLDNGGDVNAKDSFGNTPLHSACSTNRNSTSTANRVETIENLLNKRAKVCEKNMRLQTPYEMLHSYQNLSHSDILDIPYMRDELMKIEETFIKHDILLRAVKPEDGMDIEWKLESGFYEDVKSKCCQELEDLKVAAAVKDVSLYELLLQTKKPNLQPTDDFLHIDQLLCSPDLLTRFPLYGRTLKAAFRKPKLLTLAVQSFYTEQAQQTAQDLPCEVAEQLLTYLTNEDLRKFENI